MPTTGGSASDNGDKLFGETVQPAWPQSKPVLGLQGEDETLVGLGVGDLLIREGFQVAGISAAADENATAGSSASAAGDTLAVDGTAPAWPQSRDLADVDDSNLDPALAGQGFQVAGQSAAEEA